MKGGRFAPGFNTELGDSWWKIFWKFGEYDQLCREGRIGLMPGTGSFGFLPDANSLWVSAEEAARRKKENEESLVNGKFGKWW